MFTGRTYLQVLAFIRRHLRPGSLIVVLSVLIGLAVGMAAVGLKTLLHFFEANVLDVFPRFTFFFLPIYLLITMLL